MVSMFRPLVEIIAFDVCDQTTGGMRLPAPHENMPSAVGAASIITVGTCFNIGNL
jgi:hypothetical protein